jgi:uncharacterized protein with FMN-binding domain
VQVAATVTGGRLTSVRVLQYPNGDNKSVQINNRALPTLTTSALSSQGARVDTVSGATYTSVGYRQSLQSALDKARASA